MFDVRYVSILSGLDRDIIFEIMKTYSDLMKRHPSVRGG